METSNITTPTPSPSPKTAANPTIYKLDQPVKLVMPKLTSTLVTDVTKLSLLQKKNLLINKPSNPRVTIKVPFYANDGTESTVIAISGVSKNMLAAFSTIARNQLSDEHQQVWYLPKTTKGALLHLVRWMNKDCATLEAPSFDIKSLSVDDLLQLWRAALDLEVETALSQLSRELRGNKKDTGYINSRNSQDILWLWNGAFHMQIAEVQTQASRAFPASLKRLTILERLELWIIASDMEFEVAINKVTHQLHQSVWNEKKLALATIQRLYKIAPDATFTTLAIRKKARAMWYAWEITEAKAPGLKDLSHDLQTQFKQQWATLTKLYDPDQYKIDLKEEHDRNGAYISNHKG